MSPERITRRGLLLAPIALAACGFTPAYAPGGPGQRLRGRVAVEAPDTPEGFRLRARLEDRLGRADRSEATLTVALAIEEVEAAAEPDGTVTRLNLEGRAPWRLVDASGAVLAEGEARGFAGASMTGPLVGARTARQDARERLVVILADEILARLLLSEALP